jgi:WG containing repeat
LVSFHGKKGFIDKKGSWIISPKFIKAYPFSEDLALATVDDGWGKWGFIDKRGEWIILPQFNNPKSFSEGLAKAKTVNICNKVGYINKLGRWIIKPQFDEGNSFSEGLTSVRINERWTFINKDGKAVLMLSPYYGRPLTAFLLQGIKQLNLG